LRALNSKDQAQGSGEKRLKGEKVKRERKNDNPEELFTLFPLKKQFFRKTTNGPLSY
jgi:hypothetical protein